MKRLIILGICLICGTSAFAQFRFGIKGGLGTYDLGVNDIIEISRDTETFGLTISDAKFGYHIGIMAQFRFATFIVQPEVVFNSNSVDFSFSEVAQPNGDVFTEKYQNLDIPLLFGLKAGPLRLMIGPVGHYFLDSSSELLEFEEYEQKFEDLTYGWQGGIGLDFFNIMLDVRYEGNFSRFGEHITFNGQSFPFDNNPARLLASLAVTIK